MSLSSQLEQILLSTGPHTARVRGLILETQEGAAALGMLGNRQASRPSRPTADLGRV